MKMLKYMFVAFGLLLAAYAHGEETPEQKAFQSSIMQFLREEGFTPKIDEENSLTFKKEGVLYWFDFYDSSPIYLELHRIGLNYDAVDSDAVLQACNHSNRTIRCAKAMMGTSSISFAVELYCHSVEELKYIFYKSMSALDGAYDAVKKYYNEHSGDTASVPFSINSVSVANVESDGTIINDYGNMIFDFQTKYIKPRLNVEVDASGTYDVYVKFYTPTGMSTGSSSPSGYSYTSRVSMSQGNNYYYLDGWGGKDKGHWKEGDYRFEFYYNSQQVGEYSFTIH